jgi:hypothetical protein
MGGSGSEGEIVVIRLEVRITAAELEILEEMRRRGAFRTLEDCVRTGLYLLSRQLDIDLPVTAFEIKRK